MRRRLHGWLLLIKLKEYVLCQFFRQTGIVKKLVGDAVDHGLVSPNDGLELIPAIGHERVSNLSLSNYVSGRKFDAKSVGVPTALAVCVGKCLLQLLVSR